LAYYGKSKEKNLELKGQIEEFIYKNESNNYSIAIFKKIFLIKIKT